MAFQTVFKRYELKYLLTAVQKECVLAAMKPYMTPDEYGKCVIRNIYFDTDSYLLVRRSIENPIYKEKLRIRSYCRAEPWSTVFVELKRKYNKVVYKRRIAMPEKTAISWVAGESGCCMDTQISGEISYFLDYYHGLRPAVFLSYEREAFFAKEQPDFRVTFDSSILCRTENISLEEEPYGSPLIPADMTLMEIKCSGGMPLWMAHTLSENHIYKTSFSKYGSAYKTMIYPLCKREEARRA